MRMRIHGGSNGNRTSGVPTGTVCIYVCRTLSYRAGLPDDRVPSAVAWFRPSNVNLASYGILSMHVWNMKNAQAT